MTIITVNAQSFAGTSACSRRDSPWLGFSSIAKLRIHANPNNVDPRARLADVVTTYR